MFIKQKVSIVLQHFSIVLGNEIRCMCSIHHLYLKLILTTMKQLPYLSHVIFLLILGLYQVLYLKNLSPRVTERDLVSLFARFQEKKGPPIQFRMMTGRMRGQAFITFPSKQLHVDNYSVAAPIYQKLLIPSLIQIQPFDFSIAYEKHVLEQVHGKKGRGVRKIYFQCSSILTPMFPLHH